MVVNIRQTEIRDVTDFDKRQSYKQQSHQRQSYEPLKCVSLMGSLQSISAFVKGFHFKLFSEKSKFKCCLSDCRFQEVRLSLVSLVRS